MKFNKINHNGVESITVFIDGDLLSATDDHWNWSNIIAAVEDGTATADMFRPEKVITEYLSISDRIAIRNDQVVFDEDVLDNAVTETILDFVKKGRDPKPLADFITNLYQNPSAESRAQLYKWFEAGRLVITDGGLLVGYKYFTSNWTPTFLGVMFVNGEDKSHDYVTVKAGDVVTMPRSNVDDDSGVGCSTGLHIGTWDFIGSRITHTALVFFNPRDVVSVPEDAGWAKVRTCRYIRGARTRVPAPEQFFPLEHTFEFDSSFIERGVWNAITGDLHLLIHGTWYKSSDIAYDVWVDFINSSSPGRFYNEEIKCWV